MDLITMATAFETHPTTVTPTLDSDTDTPPQHPLKRPPIRRPPPPAAVVSYKECLKNHAATIGGHALDGCCEFMPGPTFSPSDPTSLTCAACGCHRNFHRRDPDDPAPLHHHPPARRPHSPPSASQLLLSLGGRSPARPSNEANPTPVILGYGGKGGSHGSRKRFRTKFSQEQKDRMYEFSEKIGWKLRKGDEKLVEDFCREVGVVRGVFKVWMHNNKHSSGTSSSPMRREKVGPEILHLHHSSNNNGTCASVVDHPFYANGSQQEAQ